MIVKDLFHISSIGLAKMGPGGTQALQAVFAVGKFHAKDTLFDILSLFYSNKPGFIRPASCWLVYIVLLELLVGKSSLVRAAWWQI